MSEQENYLAAASRIAAGICAGKPNFGFPPPPANVANDAVADIACAITDRLLDHVARRFPGGFGYAASNGTRCESSDLLHALRGAVREMAWDVPAANALASVTEDPLMETARE